MSKKYFLLFLSLISLSVLQVSAQSKTELIKVTDMLKIRQLSGVTVNPAGTKAAFVVNSIEPEGETKWEYSYNNQLYLVPTDGSSAPRMLTAKEGASQPAWSPDGKQLLFVRAVEGKPQIFLLSFDGGEPLQLTRFRYGASSPKWSPDGKKILFSSSITLKELLKDVQLNPKKEIPAWPYEKPGFEKNTQLIASNANPLQKPIENVA